MEEVTNLDKLSDALKSEGEIIVDRLVNSFKDLEKAIEGARANLLKLDNIPAEVVARLDSYHSIIDKQRSLTKDLEKLVGNGDVSEVARHISLINGLSSMIIDDARGILAGLSGDENLIEQDEILFC